MTIAMGIVYSPLWTTFGWCGFYAVAGISIVVFVLLVTMILIHLIMGVLIVFLPVDISIAYQMLPQCQ